MSNSNNDKTALSINRFRDVDINTLSEEDYIDYVLAKLMQEVIQLLEGSIQSDRIFSRVKFDSMKAIWDARTQLNEKLFKEDEE